MEEILLLDIGSTYTKGVVFDLDNAELLASAKSVTTVWSDVNIGIKKVLAKIEDQGLNIDDINKRLACSSAAGGLKMIVIGLVPSLTAEAAKRAALGAGAKVIGTYSYELSGEEVDEIKEQKPDVILLSGGTDGGNKEIIMNNAKRLADTDMDVPIVVAGNKSAADQIEDLLVSSGKEVYLSENVMAELEKLNIEPVRKTIRNVFLDKIIFAKGLSKAKKYIDDLIMPTPSAVMKAAKLLANGTENKEGFGDLMILDIGGATTDVHSAAHGDPTRRKVNLRGLEEPYIKRTVEGDLGMRYSAPSLADSVSKKELLSFIKGETTEKIFDYIKKINDDVEYIPKNEEESQFDAAIASVAAKKAVERHVGRIETVYSPFGENYVQYGKDLTDLDLIIGTGGVLIHNDYSADIIKSSFFDESKPDVLAPISPEMMVDKKYLLSAIGLLSGVYPDIAFEIAEKYLLHIGGRENEIRKQKMESREV